MHTQNCKVSAAKEKTSSFLLVKAVVITCYEFPDDLGFNIFLTVPDFDNQ